MPPDGKIARGQAADLRVWWIGASGALPEDKLLATVAAFGVTRPGHAAYQPTVTRGRALDNYLIWRAAAEDGAFEAKLPKADLATLLPLSAEGFHDNWSVCLLDRARPWPNHRALPVRDGCAWAALDPTEADMDLFVGHPVRCDDDRVSVLVSWMQPGRWLVEAHNPSDEAIPVHLASDPGWTVFRWDVQADLPAGSSRTWQIEEQDAGRPPEGR